MMGCPYCQGDTTQELQRATALGYRLFRCRLCRRTFNERTGTPFNHLQVPTDIALLVVLWRLRYKLSLRDLAEMFLTRGFTFTHEAVREWEARFAPLLAERLRAKRRGKAGEKWHADETYMRRGHKCSNHGLRRVAHAWQLRNRVGENGLGRRSHHPFTRGLPIYDHCAGCLVYPCGTIWYFIARIH